MRRSVIFVVAGLIGCTATLALSSRAQGQNNNDPNLVQRLNQLEAETQALRAELQRFQEQQPKRLPNVDPSGVPVFPVSNSATAPGYLDDTPPLPTSASSASYAPDQPPPTSYFTLDQLKGEMKKLAWKKGDFSITPYGYLWGNMVYETERSTNGDYTLWVNSPQEPGQGQPTFHVDARNTRLGIDVLGPQTRLSELPQGGGKVEIDFQNSLTNTNLENQGALLLRHAYVEVKDEEFRLLAGQTWDVISPLYPNSDHVFGVLGRGQHRLSQSAISRRAVSRRFRHLALDRARLAQWRHHDRHDSRERRGRSSQLADHRRTRRADVRSARQGRPPDHGGRFQPCRRAAFRFCQ